MDRLGEFFSLRWGTTAENLERRLVTAQVQAVFAAFSTKDDFHVKTFLCKLWMAAQEGADQIFFEYLAATNFQWNGRLFGDSTERRVRQATLLPDLSHHSRSHALRTICPHRTRDITRILRLRSCL